MKNSDVDFEKVTNKYFLVQIYFKGLDLRTKFGVVFKLVALLQKKEHIPCYFAKDRWWPQLQ